MDWFNALSGTEQALAAVDIFAAVAFLIQTTITLAGGMDDGADFDTDGDADFDTEADEESGFFLELFTIRNLLSFLTGFSWTSLGLINMGVWQIIAFPVGVMAGSFLAWLNILVQGAMALLSSSGNLKLSESIGKIGRVSLGVPEGNAGSGKVTLNVSGRQIELLVQTNASNPIERNSSVWIVDLIGDTVVVEPVSTV